MKFFLIRCHGNFPFSRHFFITSALLSCNFNLICWLSAGGWPGSTLGFGPFLLWAQGEKKKSFFASPPVYSLRLCKQGKGNKRHQWLSCCCIKLTPDGWQDAGDAHPPQGAARRFISLVERGPEIMSAGTSVRLSRRGCERSPERWSGSA